MTTSTAGLQVKSDRRWLTESVELISSMRFAISLLCLIAIASVVGTVLTQNAPMQNYVNQFGPFWFSVFGKLGVYSMYSAWWFWLILGFLVLSTSLCIARNAPKMLEDMRSWRDHLREQSLRNFHHKSEWTSEAPLAAHAQAIAARIAAHGYKVKLVQKDGATLIAAKQGAANKWGYIFAHCAIVVICLGSLLDSDLPIRFQQWFYDKKPFTAENALIDEIPAQHRLGTGNPTFRGNTRIVEGGTTNTAVIPQPDGVLIQDLPFTLRLKKFVIEHYSTGMPKLFASHVEVLDHESGKVFPATIKVNEPLIHKGFAVYQSSFGDGGSRLKVTAYPMSGAQRGTFQMTGEVNGSAPLPDAVGEYTVEWSDFRPFNVENMAQSGQDVRAVDTAKPFNQTLAEGLEKRLGSAAKNAHNKDLKNVGPSVQYKLRDKTGQAREYHNYMQPVQADGEWVFLAGMRDSPNEGFRYLRIPADENDSVEEWMRLRAALENRDLRIRAAQRYTQRAMQDAGGDSGLRERFRLAAEQALAVFAGDGKVSGLVAVSRHLEKLPPEQQEKAADLFMKILQGTLWDLWQVAREKDGLKGMESNEKNGRFLQLATNAMADVFFYKAPVYLQLKEFEEIKASVLQVTRAPGQKVVYLGCLLLVLGIFSMLYIRERRLWVWIRQDGNGKSHALMAMSTQRKTLDFEREFDLLKVKLAQPDGPAR